jgi:hypothetical protein
MYKAENSNKGKRVKNNTPPWLPDEKRRDISDIIKIKNISKNKKKLNLL